VGTGLGAEPGPATGEKPRPKTAPSIKGKKTVYGLEKTTAPSGESAPKKGHEKTNRDSRVRVGREWRLARLREPPWEKATKSMIAMLVVTTELKV